MKSLIAVALAFLFLSSCMVEAPYYVTLDEAISEYVELHGEPNGDGNYVNSNIEESKYTVYYDDGTPRNWYGYWDVYEFTGEYYLDLYPRYYTKFSAEVWNNLDPRSTTWNYGWNLLTSNYYDVVTEGL